MALRRKVVKIEWEGKEEEVVVRELTWGEYNEVLSRLVKVENIGGVTKTVVNLPQYRVEMMVKAIEKAPFKVDEQTIKSLPRSIGEKIWKTVEELNPFEV